MPSALHLSQFNVGVCNAEVETRMRSVGRVGVGKGGLNSKKKGVWRRKNKEEMQASLEWRSCGRKRGGGIHGGYPEGPTLLLPSLLPLQVMSHLLLL